MLTKQPIARWRKAAGWIAAGAISLTAGAGAWAAAAQDDAPSLTNSQTAVAGESEAGADANIVLRRVDIGEDGVPVITEIEPGDIELLHERFSGGDHVIIKSLNLDPELAEVSEDGVLFKLDRPVCGEGEDCAVRKIRIAKHPADAADTDFTVRYLAAPEDGVLILTHPEE